MQEAVPSRTAMRVALRRAAHQIYDTPIIFDDPFAIRILGADGQAELRRTPDPAPGQKQRPFSIALRAHLVARSRYAEDQLAQAVAAGVTQYVLLGAGLDTFAFRNPYPHLHVFEVDHPATQAWKMSLLAESGLPAPPRLQYTPVDFERETALEKLQASGFYPAQKTFFAWLGVVPYLTLDAFRATIAFVASSPTGSGLVFDYAQPRRVLPPNEQLAFDSLASRVALAGEPFQLWFTPPEAAFELEEFRLIEDIGSIEINERYFQNRRDQLQLRGSGGRFLTAWL
jgi:methyltransferase (TIGR00027 family)